MEFIIEGRVKVTAAHTKGSTTSQHIATDFYLDVSDNLDKKMYLDEDELPTEMGSHALTNAFVHGLIGNIHFSHEKGWKDSADHLRYIISLLENGFSTVAYTSKGEY